MATTLPSDYRMGKSTSATVAIIPPTQPSRTFPPTSTQCTRYISTQILTKSLFVGNQVMKYSRSLDGVFSKVTIPMDMRQYLAGSPLMASTQWEQSKEMCASTTQVTTTSGLIIVTIAHQFKVLILIKTQHTWWLAGALAPKKWQCSMLEAVLLILRFLLEGMMSIRLTGTRTGLFLSMVWMGRARLTTAALDILPRI